MTLTQTEVGKAQSTINPKNEKIASLLSSFDVAVQEEVKTGETEKVTDPKFGDRLVLINSSANKMEKLWNNTLQAIIDLEARNADERNETIKNLKTVNDNEKSTYQDKRHTPYKKGKVLEVYNSDQFSYSVDISTNSVIEIFPVNEIFSDIAGDRSEEYLLKRANEFIYKFAPELDVQQLHLVIARKVNIRFPKVLHIYSQSNEFIFLSI